MWRRIFLFGGLAVGGLAVVALLVVSGYIYSLTRDLPSVEALQNYQPPITTRVYAGNGLVLGEYARERRIFVPISFVPKLVVNAFTSAEDKNFYSHPGIDPSGIMRAAVKDVFNVLQHKRPEGASTITQQVARNFLLNSDVKLSRKIKEAVLAIRIDSTYSKDKILELYLNEIFLGENSYGVAAASLNYFGKSLDQLDIAEAAFLASLPKGAQQLRSALPSAGRPRAPQLGDRPDGRQRLHHAGAGESRDRRAARRAAAPARQPGRGRRTTSSKKCAASFTPNTARPRSMTAACRCAPRSTRGCRTTP